MSEQEAFDLAPKVERLTLMCEKCTYVYRMPERKGYYEVGAEDRVCKTKNRGLLVVAPLDAVPGTYYDKTKDPGIRCFIERAK